MVPATDSDRSNLPIGIFDSGVGGLTVLKAIQHHLPEEDLLYLGDTARVPYGTKSPESVTRYAEQAAQALIDRQVKALVIACNTASAVAVDPLRSLHRDILVEGVVEPGARAVCEQSRTGRIAVIATESTIQGRAYQKAIERLAPEAQVIAAPCSLFVALAEEGWVEGELLEQILARYLNPLFDPQRNGGLASVDSLVLGCTHFPVLKDSIARVVGAGVTLVDSAETTALMLAQRLDDLRIKKLNAIKNGRVHFMVTDGPARFARVAKTFLGKEVSPDSIELIDIQHYQVP